MRFTIFLITITLFTFTANINAQSETKITADDAERIDYFGISASISGDYAVVGAMGDDDGGDHSGSAYIFVRDGNGWTEQAKLTADDAERIDYFGYSVSISDDYVVIGAPHPRDGSGETGSAYIFVRDGADWTEQAKLTADDAEADDRFGSSVSISGDYAVIGAKQDDADGGFRSGSAYIFVRDGTDWSQQSKLTANNASERDYFGISASISDDYAVIGAYGDDDNGGESGSAYIFARDGDEWIQQAKLTADDAAEGDYFGGSVSISGDYAVIGAIHDDDGAGSAYIFVRDSADWTEQAKLTVDDATAGDVFSKSVFISGDYAVIGAWGDDDGGDETGSAYIFVREGADWTEQAKLTADDAAARDRFGSSISISGDYAIVGAYHDDDRSGSAYIYNLTENNIEWRGDMADIPVEFGIISAYPNPFNSAIRIGFNLKSAQEVVIQAHDTKGRAIADIYQGYYQAGQHQISWDAQSFVSGLYFVRLEAGGFTSTRKIILIR